MHKFLETYDLPELNQEDSDNMKRQITPTEIETVKNKNKNKKTLHKQKPWTGWLHR